MSGRTSNRTAIHQGCSNFSMPNAQVVKKIRTDANNQHNLHKQVAGKYLIETIIDLLSFALLYEVDESEAEGQNKIVVALRLPIPSRFDGLHPSSINEANSIRQRRV
jgi:hypothetical protein